MLGGINMNLQDFSSKIRENNKNLHKAAESTGFNKRLIDGNASKETYAEFLFNYMAVQSYRKCP